MSLLALAAVLLLVLVPTASRVLSAGAAPSGAWAQMCTVAGLKLVKLAPAAADASAGVPAPGSGDGAAKPDCAYCPLAQALAVCVSWIVLALPRGPVRVPAWPGLRIRSGRGHPCGLGSRGPPAFAF